MENYSAFYINSLEVFFSALSSLLAIRVAVAPPVPLLFSVSLDPSGWIIVSQDIVKDI